MKLTAKQIQHINREIDINQRLIDARPTKGIFDIAARREALRIIAELHNIKD